LASHGDIQKTDTVKTAIYPGDSRSILSLLIWPSE